MIDPPDSRSSQPDASAALPTPPAQRGSTAADKAQLNLGLAALQRGRYQQALTALLPLQQAAAPAIRLKAQMGLVRTYVGLNQPAKAHSLCQALAAYPNAKVQQWAENQLPRLLPADGGQGAASSGAAAPDADLSGFVPLSTAPEPGSPAPPAAAPAPPQMTGSAPPAPVPAPTVNGPAPPADPPSLFHYQRLNRVGGDPPSAPAPPPSPPPASVNPAPARLPLPSAFNIQIWGPGLAAAFVNFWLIRWAVQHGLRRFNGLLKLIDWPVALRPIPYLYQDHTLLILVIIGAIFLGSPWLLDWLFKTAYGQQPLSTRQLKAHSPDAVRIIRRVCQQRGWDLPDFRQLPLQVPLCFSYGWRPGNARIVISQGLLEQLSTEELAALYSYEMAALMHWTLPLATLLILPVIGCHQGYWCLAQWGDRQRQPLLRGLMGLTANGLYLAFWLFRKLQLWFARQRSRDGDLTSAALIQSPLSHQQTLLHLSQLQAQHIAQTGFTHPLLESLDGILAVSPQLALNLSQASTAAPWQTVVVWDYQHPYRQWLQWDLPQLPLGERLLLLQRLAQASGQPHLDLEPPPTFSPQAPSPPTPADLVMQGAPLVGLLVGLAIAMVLWFIGGIVESFNWWRLSWIYQDASILRGFLLLGTGIGVMLRINRLFPDIKPAQARTAVDLTQLWRNPVSLPVDGYPVAVSGQLTGRPGLANWLCQDLLLHLPSGLFRLHFVSIFGPLGNLVWQRKHPIYWLQQPVRLAGWARRSTSLWLDVSTLSTKTNRFQLSQHPQWQVLLSMALSLWGIMVLFRG